MLNIWTDLFFVFDQFDIQGMVRDVEKMCSRGWGGLWGTYGGGETLRNNSRISWNPGTIFRESPLGAMIAERRVSLTPADGKIGHLEVTAMSICNANGFFGAFFRWSRRNSRRHSRWKFWLVGPSRGQVLTIENSRGIATSGYKYSAPTLL